MHTKHPITAFSLITSLLLLFACGSGGSGGGVNNVSSGAKVTGIEGTGGSGAGQLSSRTTSIGAISSNDSVTVNGINYLPESTTVFEVEGELGTQADLSLGQIITIDGTINEGTDNASAVANNVRYISNVIGPISSIDQVASGFSVLGQTIWVDTATVLGDGLNDFNDLKPEQAVRVSGLISSARDIQATRIDIVEASNYQVVGLIENLDTTTTTFMVNGLQVNYSNAIIESELSNGVLVKINGLLEGDELILQATLVQQISIALSEDADLIDLEGLVTTFMSTSAFFVSDYSIITNDDTVIENGDLNDISLDARLRVEGQLNSQGLIVARRISIIHTGPMAFTGVVSDGESKTYSLQSTEDDTGLWVTLESKDEAYDIYDSENYLRLFVYRIEDGRRITECEDYSVTRFDQGACYLENNGRTTWEVVVRGKTVSNSVNYELTRYFRRAPFTVANTIDVGSPISIYQSAGDRSVYRISTADAPKGSFLAVKIDGLQNSGQLYINGDSSESAGVPRLFDCHLGNKVADRDDVVERVCWLNNEDTNNWYLSLQSTANQQYTLHVDFISPTELIPGQTIDDNHNSEYGMLYQLPATAEDQHVGILMSGLTGYQQDGENALRIRKNIPPTTHKYDCFSGQRYDFNEQCVNTNDGDNIWYALVSSTEDIAYQIKAEIQPLQTEIKDLALGSSLQVDDQGAATKAIYRVPQGALGSAFTVGVTDQGDIDFEIEVRKNLSDEDPICSSRYAGPLDDRHCRTFNEGEGYWYVTVQSVSAGSYHLWTSEQAIIELTPGQVLQGKVTASNPEEGALYRIAKPVSAGNNFIATITDKTGAAGLSARNDGLPHPSRRTCGTYYKGLSDTGCEVDYYNPDYWYIYIRADMGTEYNIKAEFE